MTHLRNFQPAGPVVAAIAAAQLCGCQSAGRSGPTPAANAPASARYADEAAVERLERAFAEATVKQDVAGYVRMMSDDFRGITSIGGAHDKPHNVEGTQKKSFLIDVYEVNELKAQAFGDLVLATSVVRQKYPGKGAIWDGEYAVSNVWRREAGQWRLFRSQWTKIDRDFKF